MTKKTAYNSGDLKSRNTWILDFLKVGFQMVGALAMPVYEPYQPFENLTIQNLDVFVRISNDFWHNDCHLSRFK